jgi:hypothetical protein
MLALDSTQRHYTAGSMLASAHGPTRGTKSVGSATKFTDYKNLMIIKLMIIKFYFIIFSRRRRR